MTGSFFLVLEGLDGSGKSEVARRLSIIINAAYPNRALLTYEPHDPSAAGDYLRAALAKKIATTPRALALGFALNRIDHNEREIAPFLQADDHPRVVVCDRYYLSSLVYQSVPPLSIDEVMALNVDARRPDLTLFMDASPETCYARMGSRGRDRELFEQNLADTREKYLGASVYLQQRGETILTVNADHDLLTVLNSVIAVLNQHAPEWLRLPAQTSLDQSREMPVSNIKAALEVHERFLPFLTRL